MFNDYFDQLVSASPPSRPHTHCLIMTGIYLGGLIVSYLKLKHMRARPVQICPSVFPTIMTPPHPSYPSGHALEAKLVAMFLERVTAKSLHLPLHALADRIGVNREYAGVHYPSDTQRSWEIAEMINKMLDRPGLAPEFNNLVKLAKVEWKF
jgi:hypothetical protein